MDPTLCWWAAGVAAATCVLFSLGIGALRAYSLARFEALLGAADDPSRMEPVHRLLEREQHLLLALNVMRGLLLVFGTTALSGALIAETLARGEVGAWRWVWTGLEATVLGALLFVAGGSTIPQALGEGHAEPVLLRLRRPLLVFDAACRPLTWFFGGLVVVAQRVFNVRVVDEKEEARTELLSAAMAGESEGVIDQETKGVIENLMEMREVVVSELMTPRMDIVSVDVEADLATVVQTALQHDRSRLPVTEGSLDKIVGVLTVRDLLRGLDDPGLKPSALMHKAHFVPETKRASDLLRELRGQQTHMAVVADEYGGTAGLVTVQDLIEEMIGDPDEEREGPDAPLRHVSDRLVDADARVRIEELNSELGTHIPEDEDVETVGGYIALRLGRIPKAGDRVVVDGASLEVTAATERRVTRVLVELRG